MWPNPQKVADLVTLTEEILNGKGFCAVRVPKTPIIYWYHNHYHFRKIEAKIENGFEDNLQIY